MDSDEQYQINYWHHTIYLNGELFGKGIEEVALAIIVAFSSIANAFQKEEDYHGIGRVNQLARFILSNSFVGYPPAPAEEPSDDSRFETSGPIG